MCSSIKIATFAIRHTLGAGFPFLHGYVASFALRAEIVCANQAILDTACLTEILKEVIAWETTDASNPSVDGSVGVNSLEAIVVSLRVAEGAASRADMNLVSYLRAAGYSGPDTGASAFPDEEEFVVSAVVANIGARADLAIFNFIVIRAPAHQVPAVGVLHTIHAVDGKGV